jgi:ribonuclease HII
MSPDLRAELFLRLLERARAVRWAVMGPRNVDRMNIRGASLAAMRKAVAALGVVPELVIVDGRDTIPGVAFPQLPIIDGDAQMLSIAAASVVAKVVRDRIMERLDRVWPAYGFAQHKGYGTPEHLAALSKLGPCPIHRFSFTPVCVQELPLEV